MANPRKRDIVLLTTVPLLLFLVLAEVGLRFYLSRNTFYDVEMSRYARTLKIDAGNPLIGHVHRPGGQAQLMGTTVRINSVGFRDDEYALERNARRRIILLGDSLTFGWGVEKEESFEHRLEAQLDARSPTELINFAAGNYNTVQQVNLFLEKGLAYQPDQVVVFYFINDAEEVPKRSRFPWLGNIRVVTFYWSRVKALIAQFSDSAGYEEWYEALYREDAAGWTAAKQAFLQLRDECADRNIALQVVLLPELHELVDYPFEAEYAAVSNFLEASGIPNLDLSPFFAGERDPQSLWVAPDDAHPNAEAHRRIAEYSFPFISEASRTATE
jgi:lysophospholipase L1-like esterase